ncbi:MAG: hypothetical protein KJ018_12025 [Burkholderiales bacterium]|nr:hypothetical protein [Burkholderiales bacterium]
MSTHDESRRAFVKKAAYVAPAIVTLAAAPAYARLGSDVRAAAARPQQSVSGGPAGSGTATA